MGEITIYAVCKIGWEYDDESYYRTGDRGGVPRVLYHSKRQADLVCEALNKAALGSRDCITQYDHLTGKDVSVTESYEVVPAGHVRKGDLIP